MNWSVLVVDDDSVIRQMLCLFLEFEGFDVDGAEDGLDALNKIARRRPDIVVLDVMMPNIDGITTCKKLRARPETADLPVIMLSGKTQRRAVEEGMAAGANAYMGKPMEPRDLLETIHKLLPVTVPVRG